MSVTRYNVRPGTYYDSVVLMQLQRKLAGLPGVVDAGVVVATPANRELLSQSDLLPENVQAGPDDLLIVVRAKGKKEGDAALAQVDELIAIRRSAAEGWFQPKSLETAVNLLPEADWVLVSVPGGYAAGVAREALNLDRHVFLYSDNVSLEDEVELKRAGCAKGLLVMGPDCGTAMINGIGLGFANRVRRGGIGLVSASGTGMQAIASRIHNLGGGLSQAIGTGGRDLKSEVGGVTARQGLEVLGRDPDTRVIVLVSKPPDPIVATKVLAVAQATGKPVVVDFIGYSPPARQLGSLQFASTLGEAASMAMDLLGQGESESPERVQRASSALEGRRFMRGLFSGGTLALEAIRMLQVGLGPIFSNLVVEGSLPMPDQLKSQGHTLLDLGEDTFTVGRLHPMLDNDLRLRRIRQEASDPEVSLILMDVVLGEGAHPNPAGELAPVIAEVIEKHGAEVVVVIIGTDEDPQDLVAQTERLTGAGAKVFENLEEATAFVGQRLGSGMEEILPSVSLERLTRPLAAINIGLETFYESLTAQGAAAIHVDWRPPAGGDERLMAILEKMRK